MVVSHTLRVGLMALGASSWSLISGAGLDPKAWGQTPNATVEVAQESQGDQLALSFKVVPQNNLIVNEEGPWALTLSPGPDYAKKIPKVKYTKSDFDFKLPGVKLVLPTPEKATEDLEYSLTAFVCTADKTRCYREVVKAKQVLKKAS